MDAIQEAIAELTLNLAKARFAMAAEAGDRRGMGLAVAWAYRELAGSKMVAFFRATGLRPTSAEARALNQIGAACPELQGRGTRQLDERAATQPA